MSQLPFLTDLALSGILHYVSEQKMMYCIDSPLRISRRNAWSLLHKSVFSSFIIRMVSNDITLLTISLSTNVVQWNSKGAFRGSIW